MIDITTSVVENATAVADITIPIPDGNDGDLLIVYLLDIAASTAAQTTPSGWTAGGVAGQNATTTNRLRSYWKERNGDTDVTFTLSASRACSAICLNFATEKRAGALSLGGHARSGLNASSTPGTPSYSVSSNNPRTRGLHVFVAWNDDAASTTTIAESNAFQPSEPPVDMVWTELARIDTLDCVQVMAAEQRPENVNNFLVTNSVGVNFGRISTVLYDEPETAWIGGIDSWDGVDDVPTSNGVTITAQIEIEDEAQSWASLNSSTDKITLQPGTYDVETRCHWGGTNTVGSTRHLAVVTDDGVLASETPVVATTSNQVMAYVRETLVVATPTDVWVEVSQGGNGSTCTYSGSLAIYPAAISGRWRVGRVGWPA